MGLAYGIGGLISVPPDAISGNGVPPASFKGQLGQQFFNKSTTPPTEYVWNGQTWTTAGANPASTTVYGTVLLTDNSEPVATKVYADALAIAGSPVSTTTTAGIGELATDNEAINGTPSTGLLALFVTPSNLAAVLASPTAIGGTVAAAGTFTDLTADGTGVVSLGANGASDFTVTGAFDLTLSSTAGSIPISAGEAVADAISLQASAGGLDVDTALLLSLTSSRNNASAIEIVASAGGIDISAVGTAGEDIDITSTGSSVNITATENVADSIVISSSNGGIDITAAAAAAGEDIDITATGSSINLVSTENAALSIFLHADGGASETIVARADQGTGDASVQLLSDVGGITLTGGKAAATAINFTTSDAAGGITISAGTGGILPTTTGKFTVISTDNAAQAIELHANGGVTETIRIRADQGTSATSIDVLSDVGGITLNAGLSTGNAIVFNASGVAGGFNIDSGTGGFIVDTTGAISLDSALASNLTVTGVADLTLSSAGGSVVITGTEAAVDAIQLNATTALGGIDINAGTGGITVDSGGLMSLDAAGVVNLTTTGAFDITVNSTAGSIVITGAEAAVDAVQINAITAGGGVDINAGSGGITADTTAAISLDSATASNFTVTGAADLTVNSTAGALNLTSGEANADSINISSAGGVSFLATGAAAKDTIITNTNGSMTLTAGESVIDAMNFTASGAASGINLTAGTNGILLSSGVKVKVTSVAAAATPYTVLGTDYFITTDTTGGVLTLTLPAAPATGRMIVVYDGVGQAAANNVTIDGNGKSIAFAGTAAGTKLLNTAYESATMVYNGTLWCAQDVV